ncbi:MAG: VCBS repeat-containing protein [Myxococcota bacterium]
MRIAWVGVLVLLTAVPSTSRADEWRTFRHDNGRTGASMGTVPIEQPAVAFRTYLGGTLLDGQFVDVDVDGDGRVELIYVSGGRVIAKRGDNISVWESEIVPADRILGLADFDEDGRDELILSRRRPSPSQLLVMSTIDGSVLWTMPTTITDFFGGIRVADFDRDGHLDMYIGTGRCGTGQMAPPGTLITFCEGATCGYGEARTLWVLTPGTAPGDPGGNCGAGGEIADVDGDGQRELILPWEQAELPVYSASTGMRESALPRFDEGTYDRGASGVLAVNLDADALPELITHINRFNAGQGARRLAAYDFVGGSFTLLWELVGPDRANDDVRIDRTTAVADLDDDGALEIVTASRIGGGALTSRVRNAAAGAILATFPAGEIVAGTLDLRADGTPEVLTTAGGAVSAFSYEAGVLTRLWTLEDRTPMRTFDVRASATRTAVQDFLRIQLNDGDAPELVLGEFADDNRVVALHGYDVSGAAPALVGTFASPDGVRVAAATVVGPMTRDHEQLLVATTDGYALILDRFMNVTNRVVDREFMEPGMRVGGFYTGNQVLFPSPLIARLADGPSILVRTSRGGLARFLPAGATPVSAPEVVDRISAEWATIADLDGAPSIVTVEGRDIVVREGDAGTAERRRLSGIGDVGVLRDPLVTTGPGGAPRIFLARRNASADVSFLSADATSGALVWSTPPRLAAWGFGNHGVNAAADFDGDGVDDFLGITNDIRALGGTNGEEIWRASTFISGGMPLVVNTDGDAAPEVYAHGSFQASRLIDGGTELFSRDTFVDVAAYGTSVQCGGVASFVHGTQGSGELFITRADGAAIISRVLFQGAGYTPDAAPPASERSVLSHVSSVSALGTAGTPALLVGSTDGYLYALEPCTLEIRWALNLRYPVGTPVVGDLNDDGDDEIVVSVADGYLYALRQGAYEAPLVRDTARGVPDVDIDAIETDTALFAAWDPVPGATSYVVSVFTESGSEIRFPNAQDVGSVTDVVLSNLPLAVGASYFVTVQAIGPDGPGLEGRSDGVTVTGRSAPSPPDAGVFPDGGEGDAGPIADDAAPDGGRMLDASGGCGCRVHGPSGEGRLEWLLVVFGALLWRRKR